MLTGRRDLEALRYAKKVQLCAVLNPKTSKMMCVYVCVCLSLLMLDNIPSNSDFIQSFMKSMFVFKRLLQ